MFKNKTIKLFLILGVILFSLFGMVGCSNSNNSLNTANEKYKYLFEEDYGYNSVIIIHNANELSQQKFSSDFDLHQYDDTYFSNNHLLIFEFDTYYLENDLEVKSTKIISGNQLLIDISIDSPANYENNFFDAQISTELLFVDVSRDSITKIENLSVGILVINTRYEDVYCSVYYNCKRTDEK